MFAYVLRRALWSIPVILLATVLTFTLVKAMPSEPFKDNPKLAPSVRQNLIELYGLKSHGFFRFSRYMRYKVIM